MIQDRQDRGARGFVSAVVLAAGRATRMGGGKLLLPVDERPMVQRVVDASLGSHASQTIVVVGHDAEGVMQALGDRPVTVVMNPDYAEGMSTSLRAGLSAVDPAADGALILLGDQPFVSSSLLDVLIDRFAQCEEPVVRASVGGRPGNPVLVSASLFREIARERGDVGGRHVIERLGDDVCLVPVDDPHQLVDIDSPQEYEKEQHGKLNNRAPSARTRQRDAAEPAP
jgi:molybdenum cofactor cytidylyltransferase